MGLQLETISQSSFEQYGPWHFHDIRFKRDNPIDLSTALLQVSAIPGLNDRLTELSRSGKEHLQSTLRGIGESTQTSPLPKSMSASSSGLDLSAEAPSSPVLGATKSPIAKPETSQSNSSDKAVLPSPTIEQPPTTRPSLKRRRPDSDVDGPGTALLSCKKRRLLRHLITSRLSEPFSLPATHILNRESVLSGDRRFLKMATILAARRMNHPGIQQSGYLHPSPSCILRRTAVINRFRLRLQMSARTGNGMGMDGLVGDSALRQRVEAASACGSQHPVTTETSPVPPLTPVPRHIYAGQAHLSPRPGLVVRPSPPGSPAGLRPTEGGLIRLPSPRMRPLRSPELRTTRPAIDLVDLDELDDDSTAFPSSEHESRYDDDPDDVYADFGLIFGGGDGDLSDEEIATEHFEDIMDDLDGIPWNARC